MSPDCGGTEYRIRSVPPIEWTVAGVNPVLRVFNDRGKAASYAVREQVKGYQVSAETRTVPKWEPLQIPLEPEEET